MNDIEPGIPYLEYYPKPGGPLKRTAIAPLPFTIGRGESAHLRIESSQVSREHARIVRGQGDLRIKDLGSTNGTFVNGQRTQEARLEHGDIVHIATTEFIFSSGLTHRTQAVATQVVAPREALAAQLGTTVSVVRAVRRFQEMLIHRCVRILFQPIVDLADQEVLGYAAIGGGDHELGRSPADHYLSSTESRLTDRLSELSRLVAVEQAGALPPEARVFLPLQPSEFGHDALVDSLGELQLALAGNHKLVVEAPEAAVTNAEFMDRLRGKLGEHGIGLAYACFSAGRSRLLELTEKPPEFLKLDKSLVQGLHLAQPRQKQIKEIVSVCAEHGIRVIAVGVETDEVARECRLMGCHAAQGDWFSPPRPLTAFTPVETAAQFVDAVSS
jgi:EAL domain-containing protein (putative c-di-GMP-specific phosphodiesterase class I)